jgi:hypothetical protein
MQVRWWKVLGVAAFVGVAATGAVIARAERRRRAYTPEEIRSRLHARLAETSGGTAGDGSAEQPAGHSRVGRGRPRPTG